MKVLEIGATETLVGVDDETVLTSEAVSYEHLWLASVQAVWTADLTGTLILEESNDGVNFVAVASQTQALADAVGIKVFSYPDICSRYLRAKYTPTDSTTNTGSVVLHFAGKGV